MAARTIPVTASEVANNKITGALWNAGPGALASFLLAPPIFRGRANATTSLTTGTWTAIPLQVSDVDSDTGHSNSVNPSRYTCQVPGWYYVEGYVSLNTGAGTVRCDSAIFKNGTAYQGTSMMVARVNDIASWMCGGLIQLAVTDYIEVYVRQNTGGTITTFIGSDLLPSMNVFWVHS